ncbi:SDR family NAD(P)-dependent oxidoreductase [Streptomyces pinistramenti]|uniref:SDR family NAD(P)-dependent oxidoreductase n=1 Tax=Streptomyces pinistramenti TaxID=2884812 RepID=UPI001D085DEA|nr:SDR family NAD(P)-dependent oxidoreductase [Streptomyces pinistramenti]MCB5912287.1 SDR family oxidoreductase [Streptomyces pinistramenti]
MSNAQRVVLISGAGRGIGAATAREFGRRGCHVIVNYLSNSEAAAGVVEDIESTGGTAQAVPADVCDAGQVDALVDGVLAEHGRIDVLVCNANTAAPPYVPFASLPWDAFAAKLTGELSGVYFLTQRVLAAMQQQRTGRIIFVSSTAADVITGSIAHSTATAALNVFSQQVSAEAARYGVAVNTVASGAANTDATSFFPEVIRQYFGERSVHGRLPEAADLGRLIALVGDEGFAVATGQVIRADDGFNLLTQQLDGPAARFGGSADQGE